MERTDIAIIGGGASGLMLGCMLVGNQKVTLLERGERLGRKLSATGNGQGNLTHVNAAREEYFSVQGEKRELARVKGWLSEFADGSMTAFFATLGVLCIADERGRVYPSGRQASALTDALRFALEEKGVCTRLEREVVRLERAKEGFLLTLKSKTGEERLFAKKVVLATGGKAAKNFGTDGSAYSLATGLGHTITPTYPSLVQLKTDTRHTKTLKGIRINDGVVTASTPTRQHSVQGDIIFTDYGLSGDAIFRLSAFIAEELGDKCSLFLDFLPEYDEEELYATLLRKKERFPALAATELLFGIVNNQVGRAVLRRANGDLRVAAALVKRFPITATGSLGFDYAQVTKGGIPLAEVTEDLESKLVKGLYCTGELLDVDGQCGGFNLQWAYTSACVVARALHKRKDEEGGQV